MARSGQIHTTRQLAGCMGQGYVFAVEYLELGLGDARERAWHAGSENLHGLHGAAIVSPRELASRPLSRLDDSGDWFDGSRGERRGRRAWRSPPRCRWGIPTWPSSSVHLESHSDPSHRAEQMSVLLDAVEQYAPGGPAIIGGDFNTNSVPQRSSGTSDDKLHWPPRRRTASSIPSLSSRCSRWRRRPATSGPACNAPGATQRTGRRHAEGAARTARLVPQRGLAARDPATPRRHRRRVQRDLGPRPAGDDGFAHPLTRCTTGRSRCLATDDFFRTRTLLA